MKGKRRDVSVEEAIALVGGFGVAQRVQLLLCGLSWAIGSLQTLTVIFGSIGHFRETYDRIQCVSSGDDDMPERETCERALEKHNVCLLPRSHWAYGDSGQTLVSDFDLLCGKQWLAYFSIMMYFVGYVAGCFAWMVLADRNQRRLCLNLGRIAMGLFNILCATAPVLWLLLVFRFFLGMSLAVMMISAFVLSYDVMGQSWKPYTGLGLQAGMAGGLLVGAMLTWILPQWRWLSFIAGVVSIVLTVMTWRLMIESPQWLLEQGRKGEAMFAIAHMALCNHSKPPADAPLADPTLVLSNPHRGVIDIIKNARLRHRIVLLGFTWVAIMVTYVSIIMMFDAIPGDTGTTSSGMELAFTGFTYEIPGIAIAGLLAERLGRKYAALAALVECGCCLLGSSILGRMVHVQHALIVASRFGIAAAVSSILILSWELFPTIVVYQGIGLLHIVASFTVCSTPWLALASFNLKSALVPLSICGSLCLGAAIVVTLLPETKDVPIPATIQDMSRVNAVGMAATTSHGHHHSARVVPIVVAHE